MSSMFDKEVNRRGTGSMKWNVGENELPMWVADMDFETAPAVTKAIMDRAAQGIYGYTEVSEEWYLAYQNWWQDRHHFPIEKDWLIFCTGVVPAISSIVRKMTTVAEKIVVMTPCYNIFFNSIVNNGRNVLESRLHYEDGVYSIDQEDLEEKLADPQTSMLILCNPHNPAGRVWTAAELTLLAALADKYGILVIADEIHGEFVFGNTPYTPYASVKAHNPQKTVTLSAASKTFNLAGLQNAFIVAESAEQRRKIDRAINDNECCDVNPFGVAATIAAYNEGETWLEGLLASLHDNARVTADWFKKTCPAVTFSRLEGTYLMWADCRSLRITSQTIEDELLAHEKVWINVEMQRREQGQLPV